MLTAWRREAHDVHVGPLEKLRLAETRHSETPANLGEPRRVVVPDGHKPGSEVRVHGDGLTMRLGDDPCPKDREADRSCCHALPSVTVSPRNLISGLVDAQP
jgi:hypothetical protein